PLPTRQAVLGPFLAGGPVTDGALGVIDGLPRLRRAASRGELPAVGPDGDVPRLELGLGWQASDAIGRGLGEDARRAEVDHREDDAGRHQRPRYLSEPRAMRRVQLRGGARRPHARRTACTLSVRPRAPTKQMGPYQRSRRAHWRPPRPPPPSS